VLGGDPIGIQMSVWILVRKNINKLKVRLTAVSLSISKPVALVSRADTSGT